MFKYAFTQEEIKILISDCNLKKISRQIEISDVTLYNIVKDIKISYNTRLKLTKYFKDQYETFEKINNGYVNDRYLQKKKQKGTCN